MPDRTYAAGQSEGEPAVAPARGSEPAETGTAGASGRGAGFVAPALAIAAALALAAISLTFLPSVPSYDPWAWITWGRELVGSIAFNTDGGPSWKPLPVVFTAPFGLFGSAAPDLWIVIARAGGLLALAGAFALGRRLGGWMAGLLAAAALLLTLDWWQYMLRAASEPLLVAAILWAILAHLDGRRGSAYVLGVAAALVRPEAWPFLGLYGLWLLIREPRLRLLVIGGAIVIAVGWFVPPWIATGDPFGASTHAASYNGHLGRHPALTVLRRGAGLTLFPVLIGAAAAALLGLVRRQRLVVVLAAGALAWLALVVVMTVGGYPGLDRFNLPAAALACVLFGAGVVAVARLLPGRLLHYFAVIALAAGAAALSRDRIDSLRTQENDARTAVHMLDQLDGAIRAAGGRTALLPCSTKSVIAVNHTAQTALAWKLRVPLATVKGNLREPGVVFRGPHIPALGAPPDLRVEPRRLHDLARSGSWHVFSVIRTGATDAGRCVGI